MSMKATGITKATILALVVTAVLTATAAADPKNRRTDNRRVENRRADTMLINEDQERYVYVTGSLIPQKVKLRSVGTNTPYNLRIYTQRELQSTGRATVAGALARDPSITVHGSR